METGTVIIKNDKNRYLINNMPDSNNILKFIGTNYGDWALRLLQNLLFIMEKYTDINPINLIGVMSYDNENKNLAIKNIGTFSFTIPYNKDGVGNIEIDSDGVMIINSPTGKQYIYNDNTLTKSAKQISFINTNNRIYFKPTTQVQQAIDNFANNTKNSILLCNGGNNTLFDLLPNSSNDPSAVYVSDYGIKNVTLSVSSKLIDVSDDIIIQSNNSNKNIDISIIPNNIDSGNVNITLPNFRYVATDEDSVGRIINIFNHSQNTATLKSNFIYNDGILTQKYVLKPRYNIKLFEYTNSDNDLVYYVLDNNIKKYSPLNNYTYNSLTPMYNKVEIDYNNQYIDVFINSNSSIMIPNERDIILRNIFGTNYKCYINNIAIEETNNLIIPKGSIFSISTNSKTCISLG